MGTSLRVPSGPGVVADPGMCARFLYGNREISRSTAQPSCRSASGRRGAEADDARQGEVRPCHSSCEAGERRGSAAEELVEPRAGAKGNAERAKHAPDAEPGRACHRRSSACGPQPGKGSRRSSPRSSTTSMTSCCGSRSISSSSDAAPGVDGVTWKDYAADLEANLLICGTGSIGAPTGRCRRVGCTSRRRTAGSGRWRLRRWRTRSSSGRWPRC